MLLVYLGITLLGYSGMTSFEISKPRVKPSVFKELRERKDPTKLDTNKAKITTTSETQLKSEGNRKRFISQTTSNSSQPSFHYSSVIPKSMSGESNILVGAPSYIPYHYSYSYNDQSSFLPINNMGISSSSMMYVQPYYSSYNIPPMSNTQSYYPYSPQSHMQQKEIRPSHNQFHSQEHILQRNNEKYVENLISSFEDSNGDFRLLSGEIVNLAHFQSGSRYLQNKVAQGNKEFIQFIIGEVCDCCMLM